MPTTYAHYTFGRKVLEQLDVELKKIILNNINIFNIGLHGPDLLFYYKPLKLNNINEIGHEMHKRNGDIFFKNARDIINKCFENDAAISYIAGFLCHFILDSECHPYIKKKENDELNHDLIEKEFDRELMIRDGLDPKSYKSSSHIVPTKDYSDVISLFMDGISSKDIYKSLKSMRLILNLLVIPGRLKRATIVGGMKLTGNYEKMKGLLLSDEPNPFCAQINDDLICLYMKSVIPAADLINEYYRNLRNNKEINKRFCRNFE